ncbi:DUF4833 domain-containing protein [Parasediminibacterium sp. JCM 36343]|uniref:DUF4833 domain-containing protein n=1 Tax=Parasediminibacterium sp. JCM 36343 TaxID=3374279 RepID=UPI003979EAB3
MKKSFTKYVGFIICLLLAASVHSQELVYPVPNGNPKQLFFLQRPPNINTIVYELNYNKNGELNNDEPVHVFWIRYGDKGERAELSYVQRNFAYGIKSKPLAKNSYELHFVSYKKMPLYLKLGADNKYGIYATINQKQIILKRIFVKINGGSFWFPNVEYAELKGNDIATGQEITERMKI